VRQADARSDASAVSARRRVSALTFLTGCDIVDGFSAEQVLMKISYFNDRAQAWLFNPNRLAPEYP
jgi:hypothetical protein